MALANPELSTLLDEHVGPDWISNMENLRKLEERQNDTGFLEHWASTKLSVKRKLPATSTATPVFWWILPACLMCR